MSASGNDESLVERSVGGNGKRGDELDTEGRFRPLFVLSFPDHPELNELVRAFESGDFKTVRERAPVLAREASDPLVQAAAGELAKRIRPDPLLKVFLACATGLALFLVVWAYW